ncbi:carbohydrate-binding protein [Acidovorax carolinensis]|uniref:Carbohydrate-binding protein n=1 Tax=Acidovorax carolinensis TaxID=553814 RepID=A0A240U2Q8_9BURK|nr:glucoamylase family protein [Acidovorax carolinensis]ART51648.1 carbohydrate-binding protein [Acidovorax carolinensis]
MLDARRGLVLEPLRAEVYGVARFDEHGRHLGASHDAGKAPFGRATFYPRLQGNVRALRAAYRYIFDAPHDEHAISPAAEWLFDNFHLIESQLKEIRAGLPPRYYRSLPVLKGAPLVGLPRVYGLAWSFVAHTDSAFDESLLVRFLNAYQQTRELTQGELWALPTTLRVVLIENLRRLAERLASHKAAQEVASLCAIRYNDLTVRALDSAFTAMEQRGVGTVFLVHLAQSTAGRRTPGESTPVQPLSPVQQWLQTAVPDLVALQNQQQINQAADQLSMGNAVTALRLIGAADWSDIISQTSLVLRVMLQSPVFAAEDEATRNTTLHGIERLSARSGQGEAAVAQALLARMSGADGDRDRDGADALAGYWLQGAGRRDLEQALGARRHASEAVALWRSVVGVSRVPLYLGALLLGSLGLLAWLMLHPWAAQVGAHASAPRLAGLVLVAALLLLPVSEIVVALVNRLISESIQPAHMPRYLLPAGIPASARVLVAIPALLSSIGTIDRLVHRLHLHFLANPEPCAQFALLTDGADADAADLPEDGPLLAHAQGLMQALNQQHPSPAGSAPRFVLLHRARTYSATQQQWIGWERKRGKLEQLVAELATGGAGAFIDLGELSRLTPQTRYVLTLDSDTQLPPGRLRALVGVAEHPQNEPRLDAAGQRVVQGYGILQPRVLAPLPARATTSLWQWMFAGQQGLDPYSAMSSDVYQDFFAEGSFTGKGLLHVATVHAVLGGRLPTDQVLSHDLLEGALVRCAVVSDVTLVEAEPEHSDTAAARLHRWTRGDWQLWPFLVHARRWGLSPINHWKLLDNLRRSLVAPASLLMLVMALAGLGLPLLTTLAVVVAAYAAGPVMGALAGLVPRRWGVVGVRYVHEASADLLCALASGIWHLALLPQQALLLCDAIVRTVHRQTVSRWHLLEWTTAEAAQTSLLTGLGATLRRHVAAPALAVGCALVLVAWGASGPWAVGWPLLALWALSPLLVWAANAPQPGRDTQQLAADDRRLLDGVARDTWRWFERCVDAQNHHLPPDNLQTAPYEVVAHRTSPTNIGLYLLSASCARQFGWIGTLELLDRLEATLGTLQAMERHRGHFLNWYDTETLQPLHPRYVSTVDSGNLCAHLVTVAQACSALAAQPLSPEAGEQAIRTSLARLQPRLGALHHGKRGLQHQSALSRLLGMAPPNPAHQPEATAFRALLAQAQEELRGMAEPRHAAIVHTRPTAHDELLWLLADHLATLHSVDRDAQAAHSGGATEATRRLMALAEALDALAWQADFRFLYHPRRHLLHIGYRLEEQQLDTSFYDLLASESRTTSLMAMAKGDLPVRHWSALGRPFFANGYHAVLRSWSGSMFEYLMPTLVIAEPYHSALGEAGRSALHEHVAYVQDLDKDMPWGISECAYAGRDHTLAYQYAPQGVPRLALRLAPVGELVIAPYATALATLVDARAACDNLRTLAALSARGRYGFYEALDFTPERQTHGEKLTLVSTYMAHHQGMTIVALANVLMGGVAQRWGRSHSRIEAVLPLLQERAPRELPTLLTTPPRLPLHARQQKTPDHVRPVTPGAQALEPTHLLSNGRYSVTLRANGAGWSRWHQTGISRWRDDALRDAHGSFLYVRQMGSSVPASVTSHPAPDARAVYRSIFHTDRVCFDALWPGLRAHTTVWVSPEDDIELRKVVVSNLGDEVIELELISALDITLATHAADEAHPAFSNLFITAQWLPAQQALRFVRTPRLQTEITLQAAHFVAGAEGNVLGLRCQTDRRLWLGRNHTPAQPLAQMTRVPEMPAALDTGLDPVAALGVMLRIAPGAHACVTFATAASQDPATLMAIIDKYRQPSYVERASAMSATLASIQWASQRPHRDYLPAVQALTTALVLTLPKVEAVNAGLRATPMAPHRVCDRRVLWQLGISGDRPLVLVMAGSRQGLGLLRTLAQALREWAHGGVACDMVVLNSEPHSYDMPLQRELSLLREHHEAGLQVLSGPVVTSLHVLRLDELSAEQLCTFASLARITLQADGHALMHQVKAWVAAHGVSMASPWRGGANDEVPTHQPSTSVPAPVGTFAPITGTFGFDVSQGLRPSKPWVNVLANAQLGALVSESGAGNTWALNSRLNQLTTWSNDPVADPPAEWLLLQDRRTREVWSLTPSAWGAADAVYRVEHAQGTTTIRHRRGALDVVVRWCVDPVTAVKQVHVQVRNMGTRREHLRLIGMVEWMMGEKRGDRATLATAPCFAPLPGGRLLGLLCTQAEAAAGFGGGTAFFCEASVGPDTDDRANDSLDWTCDRREFFDAQGDLVVPLQLGQRSGFGLDPCAALSRMVTLRAGAAFERVYLMGYAPTEAAALALVHEAMAVGAIAREDACIEHWNALLGATEVTTPDPLFDVLVNRWLLYQTVASRLHAKAGFYQAGGATGYRDQLQDAMALAWARPDTLRAQIMLCASRQFEAGDVQHWWHTPGGAGVRTHFSDDLLWLPFACTHYLERTGDHSVLDEQVEFLEGSAIPEGAEDIYESPSASATTASVYEHAARAIDRSLRTGAHGLPLMGGGDWNDGMNRVGDGGRGESVWLAWFLCAIVTDWVPLAHAQGDLARVQRWDAALRGWRAALETEAWDGDWYQRAFFDDGTALGSHTRTEGRIDLIAQAWAVLSGAAPPARQRSAMDAVEAHLVDPAAGLIQLLTPPLRHAEPSAGYIQAYPPGVRENGGQYAHGGVWALMAAAALAVREPGQPGALDVPYRYFTYLSPAHRAQHVAWGPPYGVEPYVMAADIYSQPPYVGRGGWSWYTGAAGWLHRAAVESILGLQMRAQELFFTPCLPSHWPGAEITLVRELRTLRFVLVRVESVAAQRVLPGDAPPGARLLQVGEPLRWRNLPADACFVIPLWAGAEPDTDPPMPAPAPVAR